MPSALCHPLPNEIVLGTIYGLVVSLALVRRDLSMWLSVAWLAMIVLAGHWVITECDGLMTNAPFVPANQIFILGLLAVSCRWAADLNRRFDDWNQAKSNSSARQFGIGGLLWLSTVVAIALLVVKQTSLIDRGVIYWSGLIVLVVSFSFAFSRHPLAMVAAALAIAIGLAAVDAYVVQPDKLDFASAITRYGGLLFGMIAPRLGLSLCGWVTSFYQTVPVHPPKPEANLPSRSELEVDSTNQTFEHNDISTKDSSTKIHDASFGSSGAGVAPAPQAQPTLRIVC